MAQLLYYKTPKKLIAPPLLTPSNTAPRPNTAESDSHPSPPKPLYGVAFVHPQLPTIYVGAAEGADVAGVGENAIAVDQNQVAGVGGWGVEPIFTFSSLYTHHVWNGRLRICI